MNGYCILRINKLKGSALTSLRLAEAHNTRQEITPNANPMLSGCNIELTGHGNNYVQLWKDRIRDCGITTYRKDAVLAFEVLMTYSHDSKINIAEWQAANLRWLRNTFGQDNVLSAIYHADEITPHIHAIVVPIDERNRLCAKSFINGKHSLNALQTMYARDMQPFELSRGIEKQRTRHQDIQRAYAEMKNTQETSQELEPFAKETFHSYVQRVKKIVGEIQAQAFIKIKQLVSKVQLLEHTIEKLKKKYKKAMDWYDAYSSAYGEQKADEFLDAQMKYIPKQQTKEADNEIES